MKILALLTVIGIAFYGAVHAETDACTALDACLSENGIPVIVVEKTTESVTEDSHQLKDQGRVDLHGEKVARLIDGGVIWLTEDPAGLQPALAVEGPSHLPLRGNALQGDQEFAIYTNYAAFIQELEVRIYSDRDSDHREPVAVLKLDTRKDKRNVYRVNWAVDGSSKFVRGATTALGTSGLDYEVVAYGAEGAKDRTQVRRMFFIDADLYDQHQRAAGLEQGPVRPEVSISTDDEGVLVFLPPISAEEVAFEFRPKFAELSAQLTAQDKVDIQQRLMQFENLELMRVRVAGHTSNTRIAQRSRHVFADNYALSQARAEEVAEYIQSVVKLSQSKVEIEGHGPERPIGDNTTVDGRALNRRVDATIAASQPGDDARVLSGQSREWRSD